MTASSKRTGNSTKLFSRSLEARFHFVAHPSTLNGLLGQDHEQLLVQPNRLIDALAEWITNFEVVGSKTSTALLCFGGRLKSFGKFLVLGRIADEAGVKLDRLVQERRQVINQYVGKTTTSEKGEWDRAGLGKRPMVNGARPAMITSF